MTKQGIEPSSFLMSVQIRDGGSIDYVMNKPNKAQRLRGLTLSFCALTPEVIDGHRKWRKII